MFLESSLQDVLNLPRLCSLIIQELISRLQKLLMFNERADNCAALLAELFSFAQVSSLALLGDR